MVAEKDMCKWGLESVKNSYVVNYCCDFLKFHHKKK